jgi:polyferredoxin
MKKTMIIILLFITVIPVVGLCAFAPPDDLVFEDYSASEDIHRQDYWTHDLLLKIIAVAGSTVFAVFFSKKLFLEKRIRKIYLLFNIILIGFVMGGFLCPITAVQNIFVKYNTGYLILFLIPLVSTLFFGRLYCGTICPFGALSEWLYIKKLRLKIPNSVDRYLKWIRYIILALLVFRMLAGYHILDSWTPFKNLFTFGGPMINWLITGIFVALSFFVYRPFCKYVCPYGAIMAFVNKFSFRKLQPTIACVRCGLCKNTCEMQAIESNLELGPDCILCGECSRCCKKKAINPRDHRSIRILKYKTKEEIK